MKYGFVYETTNNVDGKKYIGKCIYGRKNNWETYLGSGVYLKRAIKLHGKENFSRRILAEADSKEELEQLEEGLILKHNAVEDEGYYNLKLTSMGGDTFTNNPNKEHTRKLKAVNSKGKKNPQYNKPKTEAMINGVKKANNRAVVVEGILYESLTEASIKTGIGITTISFRLDSDTFPTYIRITPKNKVAKRDVKNKPIAMSIEGKEYKSYSEAVKELGYSKPKIRHRIESTDFPTWFII